jgi:hypothetical protein
MRTIYESDMYDIGMDRIMKRIIATIVVTIVSISAVFLGASLAAGLSSYYHFSGDIYRQADCLGKVLGFAQQGIIREIGGFNGAISECLQIHWPRSIYE